MSKLRLIIADDHPVVRAGIRGMVESRPDMEVVGEAGDGREAVRLAVSLSPDVALMDLRMPRMDGVAAIAAIRRQAPSVHVLVLTTYDTDADILRAIDAGAAGYLLKDAPRERLFEAILASARGESSLAPAVAARLMRKVRARGEEALTRREIEVLKQAARGCGNRVIAKALHISEATVKTHLLHIYGKLGVSDRTAAVTTALARGVFRLEDTAD